MKLFKNIMTLALSFVVVSCATQEDIQSLQGQIDQLKSDKISSIESQITAISSSVTKLEAADTELKGCLSVFEKQTGALESADEDLSKLIQSLKTEFGNNLSEERSSVLAALESYRSVVSQQLASMEVSAAALKAKESSLESQIASLKQYVNNDLKNSKDWASSTFMTLDKYNDVVSTLSGIQSDISGLSQSLESLSTQCVADKQGLISLIDDLETSLGPRVRSVVDSCDSAVSTAKSEIAVAYTNSLDTSLVSLKEEMKGWVSSLLTGYCSIADVEAKANAQNSLLRAQLDALAELLEKLSAVATPDFDMVEESAAALQSIHALLEESDAEYSRIQACINEAKQSLKKGYEEQIAASIRENDGIIDIKIQGALSDLNKEMENKVSDLLHDLRQMESRAVDCKNEVSALRDEMEELSDRLGQILKGIQSFVVVPSYVDGSVSLEYGPTELLFEVYPREVSLELAKLSSRRFSLSVFDVRGDYMCDLKVSSVVDNGAMLALTVDGGKLGEPYFSGETECKASLRIDSERTTWKTPFFALTPGATYVDLGLSVYWANVNIGASASSKEGMRFAWGEADSKSSFAWSNYKWGASSFSKYNASDSKKALDLEDDAANAQLGGYWRIPTSAQWDELIKNCVWRLSSKEGMSGYDVSSTINGKSIFLPVTDGYWTSEVDGDDTSKALSLNAGIAVSGVSRCEGLSVRAICTPRHYHDLVLVSGKEPGYVSSGYIDYYRCEGESCYLYFEDSYGDILIGGEPELKAWMSEGGRGYIAPLGVPVVDLGLSVNWATVNLGADDLLDNGYLYAWGYIAPDENVTEDNYKWKHYGSQEREVLDPEDDAATVILGSEYRIPTLEEWIELSEQCEFTVDILDGYMIWKVISKINGNYIYIPYAEYWTSSMESRVPYFVHLEGWIGLPFQGNPISSHCIRPVCPKN